MERYPSYNSRNFPVGVSDFLDTFPPERRNEVLAAIVELHIGRKVEEEWVGQQVQGMLELPDTLYKYVPCESPRVRIADDPTSNTTSCLE